VRISILLADDHQVVREGLRTLLSSQQGMEVVGEAEDGRTTVELARELKPDLVIMDISMPDLNGFEATARILEENPRIRVLALSMHSDRRFVERVLAAGASGYMLKDCAFNELAQAIRAVAEGKTYLCEGIAGVVVKEYVRQLAGAESTPAPTLTAREREVLQLLAEGRRTKEIAASLHVSVKTVETHRSKIMDKLDIRTVAGLTKYAVREGLTSLED